MLLMAMSYSFSAWIFNHYLFSYLISVLPDVTHMIRAQHTVFAFSRFSVKGVTTLTLAFVTFLENLFKYFRFRVDLYFYTLVGIGAAYILTVVDIFANIFPITRICSRDLDLIN